MSRRVARLTLDNLADLRGRCSTCVFWELDPVRRTRCAATRREEKAAWVARCCASGARAAGSLYVDGEPAGHMLCAPAGLRAGRRRVPDRAGQRRTPCCWRRRTVDPEYRGGGLGRMLVQGMAKDLVKRGGIRAVEAFGDTRAAQHGDTGR